MELPWRRNRPQPDVVDLRDDEVVDLRSEASPSEYRVLRVWQNVPPVRDPAAQAWDSSASLVDYAAEVEDLSTDQRRDSIEPGVPSAAVLREALEARHVAED